MRPRPTVGLAQSNICDDGQEYAAFYHSQRNELLLTPHCDEKQIVASLIHELTHWAQTLGLTNQEITIENMLYDTNLKRFGYDIWSEKSVIERMAQWVEGGRMGKHKIRYKEPEVEEYWLCLGDTHCGSEVAPMPKRVEVTLTTGDKRTITPNEAQKKLNVKWEEMLGQLPPLTGVIVNGDSCDGNNRKSVGRGTWTTDLKVQAHACADLLRPITRRMRNPENFYFTLGSEYHVVDDRPLDQNVCDLLGGHNQAEHVIPMLKGDFRVHAHHHISSSSGSWQYLTTAPARDHMLMELNRDAQEYGDINWVLRSHRHIYTEIRFGASRGGTILPGWQGKTEFAVRKGLVSVPKVGYCLLKVYEDGTATVVPYLWRVLQPCKQAVVSYEV